jgi:enoyl-[acyl-carrier protein] reductase III
MLKNDEAAGIPPLGRLKPGTEWPHPNGMSIGNLLIGGEAIVSSQDLESKWALILGASSGFGAATARALARAGMNVFGVHLDPKRSIHRAHEVIADIEATGHKAAFFNINAADASKRAHTLDQIREMLADDPADAIHIVLHSLAFGTLLPFIADEGDPAITEAQMDMTLRVMAHSLVYWVQDLVQRDLLTRGSRVFSMTSGGSQRVVRHYGAVSAAKAALESHTRQLALELAPQGILVNAIMGGLTDTPALRAIPGHEQMIEQALQFNPSGRMTTPEDIAATIVALADPRVSWVTGTVIRVDGGECIVGF